MPRRNCTHFRHPTKESLGHLDIARATIFYDLPPPPSSNIMKDVDKYTGSSPVPEADVKSD